MRTFNIKTPDKSSTNKYSVPKSMNKFRMDEPHTFLSSISRFLARIRVINKER